MEHIKQLEELVGFYDSSLKGLKGASAPVRAELEHRRDEARISLQGARGAAGLNPKTGAAE